MSTHASGALDHMNFAPARIAPINNRVQDTVFPKIASENEVWVRLDNSRSKLMVLFKYNDVNEEFTSSKADSRASKDSYSLLVPSIYSSL